MSNTDFLSPVPSLYAVKKCTWLSSVCTYVQDLSPLVMFRSIFRGSTPFRNGMFSCPCASFCGIKYRLDKSMHSVSPTFTCELHPSNMPSGNCRLKQSYNSWVACKVLENVGIPNPVSAIACQRYLNLFAVILFCRKLYCCGPWSTAHLGFSRSGSNSFDTRTPWIVKTASSMALLCRASCLKIHHNVGFSICRMEKLSPKVSGF